MFSIGDMVKDKKSILNIPDNVLGILKMAGKIGSRHKSKVFAAGGFVRDLLLGLDNLDIDIVVEGDGLKFARELARQFHGSLIEHKCFGTATIVIEARNIKRGLNKTQKKIKVDVATARNEHYKSPAAYPSIKFSTIEDDLKRRDFTINAMAISLNNGGFAEIVDFFNGRRDLKKGIIRVLHDKSFIDDPTRIFRAARFEQRYNFKIDKHTERLIKHAVSAGMLHKLKKQRMEKEIALISTEHRALRIFARLEGLTGEKNVARRQNK